jgi:two-component system NtrC family sensor kinase
MPNSTIGLHARSNTGASFEGEAATTKPLVLVVDDDVALLLLARASLEQNGFAVEEADDGAAAIEAFSRFRPDIVLLDINLPKADGFTVCSRIRQLPGGANTVVVMITGADDDGAIHTAYEVGATDFITKPLNWVLLGYRLRYVLRASRTREQLALVLQARNAERRVVALYELTRSLASASDGEQVLGLAVEDIARLLGLDVAAVRLVEGDDLVLRAATSAWRSARPRLKIGESLSGRVIAANAPVVVEDILADPRFDATHRRVAEERGLTAFVGVPIKQAGGTPLGVLFGYSRQRRAFGDDEMSLLSAFADQISVSLEKTRLAADRRQAEAAARQSEKLASMGQLLAGVAHELNNPLSVVVGYAGMVRARLTDPALQRAAEQIEAAGHRCARIVRNFLALARKHSPERGGVVLNELVTESVELVAYALRVDNVGVRLDLAADLPRLWADRYELQQMLVNLITNAHHAMSDVAMRRLVIVTRHDTERARVILRVADSGPGVPEALRDRIFEPFFTTKPAGQGTGLGLSLCYGIVKAHGGSLALERGADHGAVFRVELPSEMPPDVRVEEQRSAAPALGGGETVLVVDDEPSVTQMLADMLAADGYRVETAATGAAALDKLASQPYDVIVTDIRMPGIDGPGLYRDAARVTGRRRPTFVFMTGDLLTGQTAKFFERTAAPCLRKPFVLDDVRQVMAEARGSAARARSAAR